MIYIFSLDYLKKDRAILVSFLFVFFPIHDSTTYWYMTTAYIFTPALIMYSHYLYRHEKVIIGFPLLIVASLLSYSSPPYIFGLASIFLIEKLYKKLILFLIPGILYTVFYLVISLTFPDGVEKRLDTTLTLTKLTKNYLLQLFSSLDVIIGPSFWIKIYFSITSISLISILLSLFVIFFLNAKLLSKKPTFPLSLILSLSLVLLLSLAMFALTGLYTQISFNLGNRVTLYSSLLVSFFLATLPITKKYLLLLAIIFVLPVFGLSDYWKSWNQHQKIIIHNIETNKDFKLINPGDALLVSGNIYSKMGRFSHIEFFSAPWVVRSIFKDSVKTENIIALTSYIYLKNNKLIDQKFKNNINLSKKIYLYQSDKNLLSKISISDIPLILDKRPKEIRHWVQLLNYQPVKSFIIYLSPRLKYLFI